MRIEVSGNNLELGFSLEEYAREKFGLLEKILHRFDAEEGVALHVTLERTTLHHHKSDAAYRAAVNLHLPGSTLHAEEFHEDIRAAIDAVKEEIERQVLTYRTKHLPTHHPNSEF